MTLQHPRFDYPGSDHPPSERPRFDKPPFDQWYDDPPWAYDERAPQVTLDRLTHLVLVDGRLVDTWSEPVAGTRWQHHAEHFDRDLTRPAPPPPRPVLPPYDVALTWLEAVCGGGAALARLDGDLVQDDLDLPQVAERAQRERLAAVAELLDSVAARWFDAETSFALRRALLVLWAEDPGAVSTARTAAHVAGGVCWAVGKANGLFRPVGELTVTQVQEALGLPSGMSGSGQRVRAALWGPRPSAPERPSAAPDLLPLGRADVLLGSTRRSLVRLRDRALAAKEASAEPSVVLPTRGGDGGPTGVAGGLLGP